MCSTLSGYLRDPNKKELHDIYSIGLKTTIAEVREDLGKTLINKLLQPTQEGIESGDANQRSCWMELLKELIQRFGEKASESMEQLLEKTLKCLDDSETPVRKRASTTMGVLAIHANEDQFSAAVNKVLNEIETTSATGISQASRLQIYVQTISTIARSAGYRLAPYLDQIIPKLLAVIGDPSQHDPETVDHDLVDNCVRTLESLVLKCANNIAPHLEKILGVCKNLVRYDPNFAYDEAESEEEEDQDMNGDENFEIDDDDLVNEDDDDSSWKIRRSAVQLISVSVASRPDLLDGIVEFCLQTLSASIFEREENVRIEVYKCLRELFSQCRYVAGKAVARTPGVVLEKAGSIPGIDVSNMQAFDYGLSHAEGEAVDADTIPQESKDKITALFHHECSNILTRLLKAFRKFSSSQNSQEAILMVIRTQISFEGLNDAEAVKSVFEVCRMAVHHSASAVTMGGLNVLIALLEYSDAHEIQPILQGASELSVEATRLNWYKLVATAFALLNRVIVSSVDASSVNSIANRLAELLVNKASMRDVDALVKHSLTGSVSLFCWKFGNQYNKLMTCALQHLTQSLHTETMRLVALKCLDLVVCSPWTLKLTEFASENNYNVLEATVAVCSELLKQRSWQLRKQSLHLLENVLLHHPNKLPDNLLSSLCEQATYLLDMKEQDTTLTAHVLDLCAVIIESHSGRCPEGMDGAFRAALSISEHSTIQTTSTDSVINFLRKYSEECERKNDYSVLEQGLKTVFDRIDKESIPSNRWQLTARCVEASLANETLRSSFIQQCKTNAENSAGSSPASSCFSMLVLGEVARCMSPDQIEAISSLLWKKLGDEDAKVRETAAAALGAVCHNSEHQLQRITRGLCSSSKETQYSLLVCLKETLSRFLNHQTEVPEFLNSLVNEIVSNLQQICSSCSESHRAALTDCFSYLMAIFPSRIFNELSTMATSNDPNIQWISLVSFKNSFNFQRCLNFDAAELKPFFAHISSDDISVKQATLDLVNSLLHFSLDKIKPWLLSDVHQSGDKRKCPGNDEGILSFVYDSCHKKKELVREVNLGPFSHKIDDGLNLRKAAVAVLVSLSRRVPRFLGEEAVQCVEDTLMEEDEAIRIYGYHALSYMAKCPALHGVILNHLRQITAYLSKKFNQFSGDNQSDMPRAAVRAVYNISTHCQSANNDVEFKKVFSQLEKTEIYKEMFDAIKSDFRLEGR